MTGIGIGKMIRIGKTIRFEDDKKFQEQLDRDQELLSSEDAPAGPVSAADTRLAMINLRKEQPNVAHPIYNKNFRLVCYMCNTDDCTSPTLDIYTEHCIGYDFKGGGTTCTCTSRSTRAPLKPSTSGK